MIPYSCLEYDAGASGWNKDFGSTNLWSGGTWKSLTWLLIPYVNMRYFPIVIYDHLYWLSCWSYGWFVMVFFSGYMHGFMMCSYYGSLSWFDKLLNGWWMDGLTSVVVASLRGNKAFLVILRWSLEVYDHICIHDL